MTGHVVFFRCQAIIYTSADVFLIGPICIHLIESNFQSFYFKKINSRLSSEKWQPIQFTNFTRGLTHWPLGDFNIILEKMIFKLILVTGGCDISTEIALRWTSRDLSDDKSTLVQIMAWCRQATSHYLNRCWPRSLPPYGVTWPQRVLTKQLLKLGRGWIITFHCSHMDVITYPCLDRYVGLSDLQGLLQAGQFYARPTETCID